MNSSKLLKTSEETVEEVVAVVVIVREVDVLAVAE
jgi:hypothetical protein